MTNCTRESSFSGGQLPLTPLQATTPSQTLPVRGPVLSSQEPWSQGHPLPRALSQSRQGHSHTATQRLRPKFSQYPPGQALILPLTAAQGVYHLCMACLEPQTTVSSKEDSGGDGTVSQDQFLFCRGILQLA